jgi:hypothetical protein
MPGKEAVMRERIVSLTLATGLIVGGVSFAQEPGLFPATAVKATTDAGNRLRNLDRIPVRQRQLVLAGYRSFDWLQRAHQLDGKFVPGLVPSLGSRPENDPLQPQLEATAVLLRAARIFRDDKAAALGKQALLRMLQETTVDPAQPGIRFSAAPDAFVNRLAAGGALVRAIQEISTPPADLAIQSRELQAYLLRQQRPDGSFAIGGEDAASQAYLTQTCVGPALLGLAKAGRARNEPTIDAVVRACPVYLAAWRANKNPQLAADLSAAFAEAYEKTNEPSLAQATFEMNDWLLTMQIPSGKRDAIGGGFPPWRNGSASNAAPDIGSAPLVGSLIEACRIAKQGGDVNRYQRYRQAAEEGLEFLTSLQYTDARVQHFAEWYRPWILGGFFVGPQDGNLHLAQNQQALNAFVGYVQHIVEIP